MYNMYNLAYSGGGGGSGGHKGGNSKENNELKGQVSDAIVT